MSKIEFLTPVARIVTGDLYKPKTTDDKGQPLLYKSGPNIGQPRSEYFIGVAIPKNPGETSWQQTAWGQQIAALASQLWGNATLRPDFSWKVEDGDSQIPNTKGVTNASREGYPGHWILKAGTGYAPKLYNSNGTQELREPGAIKRGYWVQLWVSVDSNGAAGTQKPGMVVNLNAVSLQGYDTEIVGGADYSNVGFGQGVQLPPGASVTPISALPVGAHPGAAPVPGAGAAPGAAPGAYAPPAAAAPAPLPVAPHAGYMQPPAPPVAAPAAPAAPTVPVMTAKAQGTPYEVFRQQGWTDDQMRAHGYML